jgi:hypothetical protein
MCALNSTTNGMNCWFPSSHQCQRNAYYEFVP